jgi:hypothetical protein
VLRAVVEMLGPPPACAAFLSADLYHAKYYAGDPQANPADQLRRLMGKLHLADDEFDFVVVLLNCLSWDPSKRSTAREAFVEMKKLNPIDSAVRFIIVPCISH